MADSPETVLHTAAHTGALDADVWPETLQYILQALDDIVYSFPRPTTTPTPADPLVSSSNTNALSRPQALVSSQESHTTDKENAPPQTPPRPPVPAFSAPSQPDSQGFPAETITFYSTIRNALSKNFAKAPPHTIQRLAELVLQPKKHYRFLPPYLRALDRVVSVQSHTTVFPLPIAVLPNSGLLNGVAPTPATTLGSDESLGGALLTPIPWLQNRGSQSELISESTEMVEGPNGAGRIETVSVVNGQMSPATSSPTSGSSHIASSHPDGETLPSTGPVTQGEILRQEQEAGIVLSNPHAIPPITVPTDSGAHVLETVEGEEEVPHARGPEIIGMEDTGPQRPAAGLNIEAAVGRPSIERASRSPGASDVKEGEAGFEDMEGAGAAGEAKEESKEEEKKGDDDEDMQTGA